MFSSSIWSTSAICGSAYLLASWMPLTSTVVSESTTWTSKLYFPLTTVSNAIYVSSASYNAKFSSIVSGFISKNKASSSVSNVIVIIAEALSSVYSTFVVTVYSATFSTSSVSSTGSAVGSTVSSSNTSTYST